MGRKPGRTRTVTAPLWSPHSSDPLTASFDIFPSSPLIPSPAADDVPTSCRPVPLCRRRNHPCLALRPEVHAPASGAAPTRNSPAPAASAQVRWCEAWELAVHTRRAVIRVEESVKERGGGTEGAYSPSWFAMPRAPLWSSSLASLHNRRSSRRSEGERNIRPSEQPTESETIAFPFASSCERSRRRL